MYSPVRSLHEHELKPGHNCLSSRQHSTEHISMGTVHASEQELRALQIVLRHVEAVLMTQNGFAEV